MENCKRPRSYLPFAIEHLIRRDWRNGGLTFVKRNHRAYRLLLLVPVYIWLSIGTDVRACWAVRPFAATSPRMFRGCHMRAKVPGCCMRICCRHFGYHQLRVGRGTGGDVRVHDRGQSELTLYRGMSMQDVVSAMDLTHMSGPWAGGAGWGLFMALSKRYPGQVIDLVFAPDESGLHLVTWKLICLKVTNPQEREDLFEPIDDDWARLQDQKFRRRADPSP